MLHTFSQINLTRHLAFFILVMISNRKIGLLVFLWSVMNVFLFFSLKENYYIYQKKKKCCFTRVDIPSFNWAIGNRFPQSHTFTELWNAWNMDTAFAFSLSSAGICILQRHYRKKHAPMSSDWFAVFLCKHQELV